MANTLLDAQGIAEKLIERLHPEAASSVVGASARLEYDVVTDRTSLLVSVIHSIATGDEVKANSMLPIPTLLERLSKVLLVKAAVPKNSGLERRRLHRRGEIARRARPRRVEKQSKAV